MPDVPVFVYIPDSFDASRNTRFQAARYGLTWVGLAPTDRASFAWRLPSFDYFVGASE
jgi:hypothetical protein